MGPAEPPEIPVLHATDVDSAFGLVHVFDGVADQILEYLGHPGIKLKIIPYGFSLRICYLMTGSATAGARWTYNPSIL